MVELIGRGSVINGAYAVQFQCIILASCHAPEPSEPLPPSLHTLAYKTLTSGVCCLLYVCHVSCGGCMGKLYFKSVNIGIFTENISFNDYCILFTHVQSDHPMTVTWPVRTLSCRQCFMVKLGRHGRGNTAGRLGVNMDMPCNKFMCASQQIQRCKS